MNSRSWRLVLVGIAVGAALILSGCSLDNSPTAPGVESGSAVDKAGGPPSRTGTIVISPNIMEATWTLQGLKKLASVKEVGEGGAVLTNMPAGSYLMTWDPVEGYIGPVPETEESMLKFKQTLTFAADYLLPSYTQDFEALPPVDGSLAGDGWFIYGNVFDPDGIWLYGYGAFPAVNNVEPGKWCDIVSGQGGPEQGLQQLVMYSDYANGDHALGNIVESNLYQERTIEAGAVGVRRFTFDAKMGDLAGASTALAFIKTLDPNSGWAMTNFITADMTSTPETWTGYSLDIDVTGLDGQILQFGFLSQATLYEPCGIYYDNVVIAE